MSDSPRRKSKSKNITILDVARESGVSYATVSRVLSGFEFVKDATRARVIEAADRLGYVANAQARSLAGGRSQVIGVLAPGLDNGYIGEIIRGVDEELSRANYDLMLYTTHRHRGRETHYVNLIANGMTEGLILVVPLISKAYLVALQERSFPYVLIDQGEFTGASSVVDSTNWQGAYDATRYLIEQGHRRIGFIAGLMELSSAVERFNGYKAALADANLPFDSSLVTEGDFWQPGGRKATLELLPARPTAIFASNDLMALGAMEALRESGLRVPEDVSLIGFDDIPQMSIAHPKITTVHQPLDEMARMAVKLLMEQLENPDAPTRRITLETTLIIRESTGPAPEA
jgi:LacI family transcriptional regulator